MVSSSKEGSSLACTPQVIGCSFGKQLTLVQLPSLTASSQKTKQQTLQNWQNRCNIIIHKNYDSSKPTNTGHLKQKENDPQIVVKIPMSKNICDPWHLS